MRPLFSLIIALAVLYVRVFAINLPPLPLASPLPNAASSKSPPITPSISKAAANAPLIDCSGSFYCHLYTGAAVAFLSELATSGFPHRPLEGWNFGPLNNSAMYAGGSNVMCQPGQGDLSIGFCAFSQYQSGEKPYVSGLAVKAGLRALEEHGCSMCGSVGLPERVGGGILTVNYVSHGACLGVCPESRYH
ncbi:MAG: hypothetical protein Q9220_005221 [cf. Caloplaca sp. 1 TL-2023]